MAEGQGLPSGLLVESAPEGLDGVAEEALGTVMVARPVGRPRRGPGNCVRQGCDSDACAGGLRRGALGSAYPAGPSRRGFG